MKYKLTKTALCGAITLSFVGLAPAATAIFTDDFEDGDVSNWGGGTYSDMNGTAPDNADSPTQTLSAAPGFNGTASGFTMDTVMFDLASNPSWAGTQVVSPTIAGSGFAGSAPADVTMGFKYAVTADPGVVSTVRFELRETGGITTHAVNAPVADISGGLNTFEFTLDQNQSGGFTAFDLTKDHQIFVQIQQSWGNSGATRNIGLTMDDFFINTTIPEPSASLLGLIGAVLCIARRRR